MNQDNLITFPATLMPKPEHNATVGINALSNQAQQAQLRKKQRLLAQALEANRQASAKKWDALNGKKQPAIMAVTNPC